VVNLKTYKERQTLRLRTEAARFRPLCISCFQPPFGCYCDDVQSFDPKIKFVILIHPIEVRRRIATGRMSHLCLKNSVLIRGEDYSNEVRVNAIVNDPSNHCVMLYPGKTSANLTDLTETTRGALFPPNKNLVVFVIDGTWASARKMVRLSENIRNLPRVCFTPVRPSEFRVRKQPAAQCVSTIEAIHHMIELIGSTRGYDLASGAHENMLDVFRKMVWKQVQCIQREDVVR
jgi:DTW domain-containing protein YfiP